MVDTISDALESIVLDSDDERAVVRQQTIFAAFRYSRFQATPTAVVALLTPPATTMVLLLILAVTASSALLTILDRAGFTAEGQITPWAHYSVLCLGLAAGGAW